MNASAISTPIYHGLSLPGWSELSIVENLAEQSLLLKISKQIPLLTRYEQIGLELGLTAAFDGFVCPQPLTAPLIVSSTAALNAAPQFGSLRYHVSKRLFPIIFLPVIAYLAPPIALLNQEQISCEKQSCVYTLPSAAPEQPAPQRPLQL